HLQAITDLGLIDEHRRSFSPVKDAAVEAGS
ncbi:MAG: ribonuclease HII, partial [Alkalicoccus sp.]